MQQPQKPDTQQKPAQKTPERQPYEPPKVQSVKLSDEAAESLT